VALRAHLVAVVEVDGAMLERVEAAGGASTAWHVAQDITAGGAWSRVTSQWARRGTPAALRICAIGMVWHLAQGYFSMADVRARA
jgi:hypothetical protein